MPPPNPPFSLHLDVHRLLYARVERRPGATAMGKKMEKHTFDGLLTNDETIRYRFIVVLFIYLFILFGSL